MWKKIYKSYDSMVRFAYDAMPISQTNKISSPVEDCVEAREYYLDRINMIKAAAKETDDFFENYILLAVTEGLSYTCLKAKYDIPCCKETYYELYRRFFWLLSKRRQ